jgi:hypothetical protein
VRLGAPGVGGCNRDFLSSRVRATRACLCRIELSKMQNFGAKSLMY